MANEANAPPAAPQPQFRLTPAQMTALHLIEMAQASIAAAADRCANQLINEADARKLLVDGLHLIEAQKLEWLKATQRAVQLVPDLGNLADRVKANGRTLGG